MKQKDVVLTAVAVGILLVAGYLVYSQLLAPKSAASKTVTVEKVGPISESLNSEGIARISDTTKVVNFNSLPDYTGLGNLHPFGP